MKPVYEPANADGLKPFIVTVWRWGQEHNRLVWAENTTRARQDASRMCGGYVRRVRRAAPEDVGGVTL